MSELVCTTPLPLTPRSQRPWSYSGGIVKSLLMIRCERRANGVHSGKTIDRYDMRPGDKQRLVMQPCNVGMGVGWNA